MIKFYQDKKIKKNCFKKLLGVTLIELVTVIAISAVLASTIAVFITRPITLYAAVTRRAELLDAADLSLRRMTRDIQQAVPNSVRVKIDPSNANRVAIEFLNVVEGLRYRAAPTGSAGSPPFLDFNQPINQFDVIGQFQFATTNATCAANGCRVVVYNTGANTGGAIPSDNPAPGANVYSLLAAPTCSGSGGCIPTPGSYTITPVATTVTLTNPGAEGRITLGSNIQFGLTSPRQRLDIVDTPVTYLCDVSQGQQKITRYWNYTIAAAQPTDPATNPLSAAASAQLTKDVSACSFNYAQGTAQRNGVVSLTITLTNPNGNESVTLMREVSVDNAP